jgi:hypothetical protein
MNPVARQQAAGMKAASASRETTRQAVAKLLRQPAASTINVRLAIFTALMFVVWPVAWVIVAPHVIGNGFDEFDIPMLLLPVAGVLAWSFLMRAQLADRGALQLLTLGFGALAPTKEGDPARCRRCQGPLPDSTVGGVVECRYCGADNVVGLDLRPLVGPARAEQATLEASLQQRSSEKTKWTVLSVLAVGGLLLWMAGTTIYLVMAVSQAYSNYSTPTAVAPTTTVRPTATPTQTPTAPPAATTPSPTVKSTPPAKTTPPPSKTVPPKGTTPPPIRK